MTNHHPTLSSSFSAISYAFFQTMLAVGNNCEANLFGEFKRIPLPMSHLKTGSAYVLVDRGLIQLSDICMLDSATLAYWLTQTRE